MLSLSYFMGRGEAPWSWHNMRYPTRGLPSSLRRVAAALARYMNFNLSKAFASRVPPNPHPTTHPPCAPSTNCRFNGEKMCISHRTDKWEGSCSFLSRLTIYSLGSVWCAGPLKSAYGVYWCFPGVRSWAPTPLRPDFSDQLKDARWASHRPNDTGTFCFGAIRERTLFSIFSVVFLLRCNWGKLSL